MTNTEAFDNMEDDLEEAEELLISDVAKFQPRQLIHLRKDSSCTEEKLVS